MAAIEHTLNFMIPGALCTGQIDITVGKKLAQGLVELSTRKSRTSRDVAAADVVGELRKAIDAEFAAAVWPGK